MANFLPPFGSSGKYGSGDVEAGDALYPGIDATENMLRHGFIRKTFGIVSCQLALTALVTAVLMVNPATQVYLASSVGIQVALMLLTFLGLIPLYMYKAKHPTNLFLLAAWVSPTRPRCPPRTAPPPPSPSPPTLTPPPQTGIFSVSVGLACTFFAPALVLEALVLTAGVVGALTLYTFWATKRGQDFTWLGGLLFASLWTLIIWGFLQIVFRPGPVGQTIYSLLGALVFCGCVALLSHLTLHQYG